MCINKNFTKKKNNELYHYNLWVPVLVDFILLKVVMFGVEIKLDVLIYRGMGIINRDGIWNNFNYTNFFKYIYIFYHSSIIISGLNAVSPSVW
jgi:hypothetical protein